MAIKQIIIYIILLASFVANCFVMNLNRTINFESNLGHVAVYDEAMPEWLSSTLSQFFQPGNRWTYQYPDELLGVSAREKGNFQWVAPISPRFFMQSKPWIVIATLMKNFTGENGYMAYHVMGTKIRRGFFPTPVPGTNSSDVYIRIFLTGSEEMKGLSEMVFFDENNEIIRAVQPKFNRVVVWNGSLTYMTKPVDYDNFNLEHSLWIRLSKDPQKYKNEMEYIMNLREEEAKRLLKPFPFKNVTMPPFSKDYYDAHCTRKFYNRHGSVIGVFDNLLTEEELVHLTKYVASHKSGYSSSDYMTTETDDADNVNWITMFEPEDINLSKMLRVVKDVAFYLSGEDDWHPYDVALNMVQNTFHTRIHEDCEPYEYEYTFLLYLNPNWTENMYGETIFLDKIQDMILDENDTIIQDKEYETIMAVRPKYGRIAMFRNNISHSARPPSPDFHGTRYTFAVKVSKNKKIALMKSLKEVLEFKAESDDTEAKALSTSVLEMLASQHFTMTLPEMKGNLTKYRNEKKASMDKDNLSLQTTILRKAYVGKDQPSV